MNTLLEGDCLETMLTMTDNSIDMILCDLPYGTTSCKWDAVIPFDPLWAMYARLIKDNAAIVLTASQPFTSALVMSNPGWFKYCWIWEKTKIGNIFNCKNAPQKNYEDIAVFSNGKIANCSNNMMKYNPQGLTKVTKIKNNSASRAVGTIGDRPSRQGDYTQEYTNYPRQIIKFQSPIKTIHPTQKPVALFEYLIRTYTNEGDTVLDNCAGSGTTAIACIRTNRKYILIEKEPEYIEVIRNRIKNEESQPSLIQFINQKEKRTKHEQCKII